ncbi:ubiquitin-protein ligase peroxin 12 [Verticillium nonalfalfae]|uniref:Peroxisome assembly protein 12 n=1 Tax=Verticillium nonalfalfae TaxID=1051616 RepID=A0A3M9Y262_9PEZI|nr:ubiquitin-protein ligase peroxin 12 [Verticillium nonalfalfae]RNJ54341.1 ubiquitin-protein ligase peroxin 12 [Verticillium nonalfalfae]
MEFMTALPAFDEQKPSLFELLSEQQLNGLLPPTLRYLLTVATQRYPRYLLRVLNSFDELHALLMLLVERHYLRTRGGSFTEHFYGLKREKALHAEIPRANAAAPAIVRDALRLRTADVWKNLAVMVALPYLKRKLDDAHEVNAPRALLGAAYTRLPANPTPKQRLLHCYRWFLRTLYPSVNAAYQFAVLAFHLAYLFDTSKYHHPFLWIIGTRVRRMNADDYRAIDALTTTTPKTAHGRPPGVRAFFAPRALAPRLLSSLSVLLPASIFALKFLEWWHASDFAKQLSRKAGDALDLPPPVVSGLPPTTSAAPDATSTTPAAPDATATTPATPDATATTTTTTAAETAPIATPSLLPIYTVPAPADTTLCPVCAAAIVTPTACQTGFVYCYSCIHRWLEGAHPRQEAFMEDKQARWESGAGRCAVTGRRVLGGTEGLRRIIV